MLVSISWLDWVRLGVVAPTVLRHGGFIVDADVSGSLVIWGGPGGWRAGLGGRDEGARFCVLILVVQRERERCGELLG